MGAWQEVRVGGRSAAATGYEERIDNESIANLFTHRPSLGILTYSATSLSCSSDHQLLLVGEVGGRASAMYCYLYETTLLSKATDED